MPDDSASDPFEASPGAQVVTDRDGTILRANAAAAALLGVAQPAGNLLSSFVRAPDRRWFARSAADVAEAAGTVHLSLPLDGGAAESRTVVALVRASSDARRHWLLVDRAALRGPEREFVRNAAHELRTPLTAISTAIEVLQGGAKENPEERDRFLAHIERQCARLNRLARSMLVLARAQSGQQAPSLSSVPVRPLLEEIAASLQPAERVAIEIDCAPGLAVLADRDLAEHAVANLASNATRHTRSGTIRLEGRPAGEGRVEIVVADEGEGIAPEHQARLLEPFYRGGAIDSEGFGLGLAIASQAVAELGGTLAIDSEQGVGTRAVISLRSARLPTTP